MASGLDLEALARLEAEATPGPSHVRHLDDDHCMCAVGISLEPDDGESREMATFWNAGPELVAATLIQAPPYVISADQRWGENAQLIAAMRNAFPELLRLARIGVRHEAEF